MLEINRIIVLSFTCAVFLYCFYFLVFKKDYATHNYTNANLKFYSADLDHDGKIGENEKRLTWKESYDELLKQSSDFQQLEKFADKMNISKNLSYDERINLARNEILHQAEDLLISTGCVIPIFTNKHIFLVQDYLKNVKHNVYRNVIFDFAKRNDGKKDIKVIVGSEPVTLDPCIISQVQSASIIENCMRSILFRFDGAKVRNEMGIIISDFDKKTGKTVFDIYLGNFNLKEGKAGDKISDYEFIDDVFWDDGKKIVAKDLIWAINRAASPVSGAVFPFFFENVVGNKKWVEQETKRVKKQGEFLKTHSFYQGMEGVKETSGEKKPADFGSAKETKIESVRVEINNNPVFFKEGLSNISLVLLPRHHMTKNFEKENEELVPDWWQYSENNQKDGCYLCCNGPFKVKSIEPQKNGKIVLVKNDKYAKKDKINLEEITFNFCSNEDVAVTDFFNKKVDFNSLISRSQIKISKDGKPCIKEEKGFENSLQSVDLPSTKYLVLNVNDDSLDSLVHKDDDPITAEEKRQKARYILALLIDRNHIANNIEKGFAEPSRGIVSCGFKEEPLPIKKDNKVFVDKDSRSESSKWDRRNSYVPNKYNRFDDRCDSKDESKDGGFFEVCYTKPEDKDYERNVVLLKMRNLEKVITLANEIGLKYVYDKKKNIFKFLNFPKINLVISSQDKSNVFEHIKEYYSHFGITVNLDAREFNYVCSLIESGDFSAFTINYSADFMDPMTYLSLFKSDSVNNFCQLGKDNFHKSYNLRNGNVEKGIRSENKKQ